MKLFLVLLTWFLVLQCSTSKQRSYHYLSRKNPDRGGFIYIIEFPFDDVSSKLSTDLVIAKVGISGTKSTSVEHPGADRWKLLRNRLQSNRDIIRDQLGIKWNLPKNTKAKKGQPILPKESEYLKGLLYVNEAKMGLNVEDVERLIRRMLGVPCPTQFFYYFREQFKPEKAKKEKRIGGVTEYVITDRRRLDLIRRQWETVVKQYSEDETLPLSLTINDISRATKQYSLNPPQKVTVKYEDEEVKITTPLSLPISQQKNSQSPKKQSSTVKKQLFSPIKKQLYFSSIDDLDNELKTPRKGKRNKRGAGKSFGTRGRGKQHYSRISPNKLKYN